LTQLEWTVSPTTRVMVHVSPSFPHMSFVVAQPVRIFPASDKTFVFNRAEFPYWPNIKKKKKKKKKKTIVKGPVLKIPCMAS